MAQKFIIKRNGALMEWVLKNYNSERKFIFNKKLECK